MTARISVILTAWMRPQYLEEQVEIPVQVVDLKTHLDVDGSKRPILLSGEISPAPVLGLAMRDLPWL